MHEAMNVSPAPSVSVMGFVGLCAETVVVSFVAEIPAAPVSPHPQITVAYKNGNCDRVRYLFGGKCVLDELNSVDHVVAVVLASKVLGHKDDVGERY